MINTRTDMGNLIVILVGTSVLGTADEPYESELVGFAAIAFVIFGGVYLLATFVAIWRSASNSS